MQKGGHAAYSAADEALFSKVSWHLLPLLIVCYIMLGLTEAEKQATRAAFEACAEVGPRGEGAQLAA